VWTVGSRRWLLWGVVALVLGVIALIVLPAYDVRSHPAFVVFGFPAFVLTEVIGWDPPDADVFDFLMLPASCLLFDFVAGCAIGMFVERIRRRNPNVS
jgi:hypothetical protein